MYPLNVLELRLDGLLLGVVVVVEPNVLVVAVMMPWR